MASAYDAFDPTELGGEAFGGADERPPDHKSGGEDLYQSGPGAQRGQGAQSDELAVRRALMPIPHGGPLLEEASPKKLFREVDKEVERQEPLARNREEQRRHWEFVRAGAQFSILEKNEDLSVYKQVFPPGIESAPNPVPNKVNDLCDKIINQILIDPPLPNPKLDDPDNDRQRAAADLTRRFLRSNATPQGTNDLEAWRQCLNINITQKSAFIYAYVDDTGGGWRPKQIRAHPEATDPEHPFMAADGSTEGERVLRFVAMVPDPSNPDAPPSMQFTEDAAAAERQWCPKIINRVLTPSMVRTLPKYQPLPRARGVILLLWDTLGEAKRLFPILATLPKERLRTLCSWKPKRWQAIVPEAMRAKGGAGDGSGEVTDDTLFFWYHRFCRSDEDYPDGAEVALTGAEGGFLLRRETLREDVELDNGTHVPVIKDIPVAQFVALQDAKRGDPFGREPIEKFAGSSEIYAHLWLGVLTAMEKGLNPIPFIPGTSPVSREDMTRRDGRPVEVLSKDDMPTWEQPPQLPGFVMDALGQIEVNMNSEAGTNETANNLDSKYATSGVAKNVAIRQAKVSLAQYWQNTASGIVRTWQIYAQLAMAHYTIPQQVMLSGTGAYKRKWWIGSDLNGVSEIVMDSGSFTMMAPGEKLAFLQTQQANQWLSIEAASEVARSVMSDDLGLQPDPHDEHIDRQIAQWSDGPPPSFAQILQANTEAQQKQQAMVTQRTQALQATGTDPQTAQQQAQQQVPPPQTKPLPTAFQPRPNDEEPGVAKRRAQKLSRFMASPEYGRQPVQWQQDLAGAWWRAFLASGGQTVKMQQEAAQHAAQQQQQAEAATKEGPKVTDATYQEFLADIRNKVIASAASTIAKEIKVDQGDDKGLDAAQALAKGHADAARTMSDLQNAREDRAHKELENARDRAHEHLTEAQKHTHALHKQAAAPTPVAQRPPSLGQGAVPTTEPGTGIMPNIPGLT